ncbi:hypothetical protein AB837_00237 [bacterium AB1]|nr:hypothetical protein AB837_00237 [bacterium AB1]
MSINNIEEKNQIIIYNSKTLKNIIDSAQQTIHMSSYNIGINMAKNIADALNRGVVIYIITDSRFYNYKGISNHFTKFYTLINTIQKHCKNNNFNTNLKFVFSRDNVVYSHEKYLVIDCEYCVISTGNFEELNNADLLFLTDNINIIQKLLHIFISDFKKEELNKEYINLNNSDNLKLLYCDSYNEQTINNEKPDENKYNLLNTHIKNIKQKNNNYIPEIIDKKTGNNKIILNNSGLQNKHNIIDSKFNVSLDKNSIPNSNYLNNVESLIQNATKRIYIGSLEWDTFLNINNILIEKAKQQLEIIIILNTIVLQHTSIYSFLTYLASLNPKVKIYIANKIHAKFFVCDSNIILGSANNTANSYFMNREIGIQIMNATKKQINTIKEFMDIYINNNKTIALNSVKNFDKNQNKKLKYIITKIY